MIQVTCECGRVIKAKDEFAGKKVRCPDCQEVVALTSKTDKGSAKASSKKTAKRPVPDDEYFDDGEESDEEDEEIEDRPRASAKKKAKKKGSAAASDGAEKTGKKKKKKPKDDSTKTVLIITGVLLGLSVLGGLGYLIATSGGAGGGGGAAGPAANVPNEFVALATPQSELICMVPKGWESKTGGGTGGVPAFARVENSGITINFKSSQSGASIQMMSQAGGGDDADTPDEEKAVAKVHDFQKAKAQDEMSGYQEAGAPEKIMTKGFGEGRISAFTCSETFSTAYGYRATLLGTNNQWVVICKCSASQWKDYQPIFKKVIESAGGN